MSATTKYQVKNSFSSFSGSGNRIDINTLSGQPTKIVKATLEVELTFRVGGDNDDDRVDAVRMALDDHYDETVANSF